MNMSSLSAMKRNLDSEISPESVKRRKLDKGLILSQSSNKNTSKIDSKNNSASKHSGNLSKDVSKSSIESPPTLASDIPTGNKDPSNSKEMELRKRLLAKHSQKINAESKAMDMTLCPFELLGTCNDVSCLHHHTIKSNNVKITSDTVDKIRSDSESSSTNNSILEKVVKDLSPDSIVSECLKMKTNTDEMKLPASIDLKDCKEVPLNLAVTEDENDLNAEKKPSVEPNEAGETDDESDEDSSSDSSDSSDEDESDDSSSSSESDSSSSESEEECVADVESTESNLTSPNLSDMNDISVTPSIDRMSPNSFDAKEDILIPPSTDEILPIPDAKDDHSVTESLPNPSEGKDGISITPSSHEELIKSPSICADLVTIIISNENIPSGSLDDNLTDEVSSKDLSESNELISSVPEVIPPDPPLQKIAEDDSCLTIHLNANTTYETNSNEDEI